MLGDEFFGIAQGLRLDGRDFRTMAETGVATDRLQLVWPWVQPKPGPFNWGPTDTLIGALASHGIRVVPFIWGSPRWVARPPARPPLNGPDEVEAWQAFLEAAVARYGRGGSYWGDEYRERYGSDAEPLPIESWQIWNEPNLTKYFAPSPSVRGYARLLVISQIAIRNEDPQARIVLAGMPGYGDIECLGLSRQPLLGGRNQEPLRRRRPTPVRTRPRPAPSRDRAAPRGDEETQ